MAAKRPASAVLKQFEYLLEELPKVASEGRSIPITIPWELLMQAAIADVNARESVNEIIVVNSLTKEEWQAGMKQYLHDRKVSIYGINDLPRALFQAIDSVLKGYHVRHVEFYTVARGEMTGRADGDYYYSFDESGKPMTAAWHTTPGYLLAITPSVPLATLYKVIEEKNVS